MGIYINKGNDGFASLCNSKFVDKSMLIAEVNSVMMTENRFLCVTRARRFGKSVAVKMLNAYYDKSCDSHELFDGLAICKDKDFEKHLNHYPVLYLDMTDFVTKYGKNERIVEYIKHDICEELLSLYDCVTMKTNDDLMDLLVSIVDHTGEKFICLIDEWDALCREGQEKQMDEYVDLLRRLFKGSMTEYVFACCYMTGILPIKRYNTQSALNNFDEYTMLSPAQLAPYFGFTEKEVGCLCADGGMDIYEMKRWYDGYLLGAYHVYNPCAVVNLIFQGTFQSYWSQTGTYESIVPLINMNFDGLKTDVVTMLSGDAVAVRTTTYQNDMVTFKNKNDVMTLLIHLGYLAYDQEERKAYIPNEEIRSEFLDAIEDTTWNEFVDFQKLSAEVLDATLELDAAKVARLIEKVHMEYASVIQYNNENSLSSVLSIAYLGAMQYYFKPVREMPLGRGFADFVFIPKQRYAEDYPALVVELKWNKSAATAIKQIRERRYPASLQGFAQDILLVGINYDKQTKEHTCSIEKLTQ